MATHEPLYRYDFEPTLEPEPELARSALVSPPPLAPVIDRRELDLLRPYFFYVLAFGAFLVSATSTVMQTALILQLMNLVLAPLVLYAIGAAVALIITLGELMTNESWWYMAFLGPDIALTVWWVAPAFEAFVLNIGAPVWLAYGTAACIGVVSAYLPERVLLGARRKGRRV